MAEVKNFLYTWCSKNHLTLNYEYQVAGGKFKKRFTCQATVSNMEYIGLGNSSNKKDAQAFAARDFLSYLVRIGRVDQGSVPFLEATQQAPAGLNQCLTQNNSVGPSGSNVMMNNNGNGQSYAPYIKGPSQNYMDELQRQQKLEEAENLDMNAEMHGNWTVNNAKSRLHQYMQTHRLQGDYIYSSIGAFNNMSFIAELKLNVKERNTTISAREHGSTKLTASKSCALSLVRQLFHMGVIEAFKGNVVKKDKWNMEPYEVVIYPEVREGIDNALAFLEISPPKIVVGQEYTNVPTYTELNNNELPQQQHTVVWSPPQPNWNPWKACNIDEGPLAQATLPQISEELGKEWQEKIKDPIYKTMLEERIKLPVFSFKDDILQAIESNTVVVIRGATGCGKTTQVPQYVLDSFLEKGAGAECAIVVTQPRRLSCLSISERVAQERSEYLGNACGYSVRFESNLPRPYGSILYCTMGVLLRKLEVGLRGISHIIVDEIHERDLNSDFLLIILKEMVPVYPNIRIILMSATIDASLFTEYFGGCPIVDIQGRSYPVQEYFLEDCVQMTSFDFDGSVSAALAQVKKRSKKGAGDEDGIDEEMPENDALATTTGTNANLNALVSDAYAPETRQAVRRLSEKQISFELIHAILQYIDALGTPGAVLIFLPGWNYIFSLMKYLKDIPQFASPQAYIILPLHSLVPIEDQRKIFAPVPEGVRKIILSTNIAETSVTINDVVFVIDSCKVKIKMFTSHNNMTNYATAFASKSNLAQRTGRAGRVQPGFCFHLCSRARFERLDAYAVPEIFRTPLHEIALTIKLLKLGDIQTVLATALEPPPLGAVHEAEILLKQMGALTLDTSELTPLGKVLARLPVDPRIGKMIVAGTIFGVGDSVCALAAFSCFPDPFVLEMHRRRLHPIHKKMAGRRFSDHVALLKAFQGWEHAKNFGESQERSYCEQKMLSLLTLRMVNEARNQFKSILLGTGFPEECLQINSFDTYGPDPRLDMVIAVLCLGFYPNVCVHKDKRRVYTTEGKDALIHKASVVCSNYLRLPCPFFIFGEKIRTRAVATKDVSMISPLHLLAFGSCKVVPQGPDVVCVDNWINLKMDSSSVLKIFALRQPMENIISDICERPELLMELLAYPTSVGDSSDPNKSEDESSLKIQPSIKAAVIIDVLFALCGADAGRYMKPSVYDTIYGFGEQKYGANFGIQRQGVLGPYGNETTVTDPTQNNGDDIVVDNGDLDETESFCSNYSYHISAEMLENVKREALLRPVDPCTFAPTHIKSLLSPDLTRYFVPQGAHSSRGAFLNGNATRNFISIRGKKKRGSGRGNHRGLGYKTGSTSANDTATQNPDSTITDSDKLTAHKKKLKRERYARNKRLRDMGLDPATVQTSPRKAVKSALNRRGNMRGGFNNRGFVEGVAHAPFNTLSQLSGTNAPSAYDTQYPLPKRARCFGEPVQDVEKSEGYIPDAPIPLQSLDVSAPVPLQSLDVSLPSGFVPPSPSMVYRPHIRNQLFSRSGFSPRGRGNFRPRPFQPRMSSGMNRFNRGPGFQPPFNRFQFSPFM